MKLHLKISLCTQDNQRFFGSGVYQLLLGIQHLGSLRAATMEMGMAYSKAFRIMKYAEEQFGFPLTRRRSGGAGGGGSELTDQALELIRRYQLLLEECAGFSRQMQQKYFGDLWEEEQG